MVVEELAEDLHEEPNKVLYDFLQSKIGKALYDESTKALVEWPFLYSGYV